MVFRRQSSRLTPDDFARLYEENLDVVFNYCLFRVGDRQVAEDLTADTFERAWQFRRRYDPQRASFITWLLAIARHRVTDQQRKQGQKTLVPLDDQREVKAPLPEEEIARGERVTRLRSLVQALPDGQRELIALKFGAGLTNRRIGEIVQKSETAVGSAIYRAVEKLRQQWAEPQGERHDE